MNRLILFTLAIALGLPAMADTIRLRADAWFPVNGDPAAARPGFGIEALKQIWGEAGYRLDYEQLSWSRSLEAVRSGAADCVIGAYKEDAPDLRFHTEYIGRDAVGVYVRTADTWEYGGTDSLARRNVGVISDYSYGEELDAWLAEARNATRVQMAYGSDALEGNIRKLLAGRVDVLLESPMVMSTALSSLDLERFVRLAGEAKEPTPYYVACSPDNPRSAAWLQLLDDGLRRMRESGEWDRLLADYGLGGSE